MGRMRTVGVLGALTLAAAFGAPSRGQTVPPDRLPGLSKPSLPTAPDAIGRLRRDRDGHIVSVPETRPPQPSATPGRQPFDDRIGPPARAVLPPPAPETLPGYGERPDIATPVFDPRRVASLQDTQKQQNEARRHQADVDRILEEEKRAKQHGAPTDERGLTAREMALEQALARIDREVREHEMEHYRAALPFSSLPEYWSVTGPLGQRYAVTGITRFEVSEIVGNREETIRKYETLLRAALAPRDPSTADREVAEELMRLLAVLRSRK